MIYWEYLENHGIHYYSCLDPLDLDDLMEHILRTARSVGAHSQIGRPTFFDLNRVDLLAMQSQDLRRFINRRRKFSPSQLNNLLAVKVRCDGCFGMMRMYNIYAEIDGLRDEENSFVSMDLDEIALWLARAENLSDSGDLLRDLKNAGTRADAYFTAEYQPEVLS